MEKIYNRFIVSNSDSWNFFYNLRDLWRGKGKILENLCVYLKEKSELDKNYAKGLERLSKLPIFEGIQGSLGGVLTLLQTVSSELSTNLLIHSKFIESELILSIKATLASGEVAIKEIRDKVKGLIIEREQFLKKNENFKAKYLKSNKGYESPISTVFKYFQGQSDLAQDYKLANENLNSFNLVFIDRTKQPLDEFRERLHERILCAKSSLQLLVSSEAGWVYNCKMHFDNLAQACAAIFVHEDKDFIEGLISEFIKVGQQDCVVKENETFEKLKKIIFYCWEEVLISPENFEFFKEAMNKIENRKIFIRALNEKRKQRQFLVTGEGFRQLGELFRVVLDALLNQNDFHCARQCIILSQTFFNSEKVFIQSFIVDHPLWETQHFWQAFVENSIDLEIFEKSDFRGANGESDEFSNRVGEIAVATLASYIHIMVSFQRDPQIIKQVAEKCKSKYSISESQFCTSSIIALCKEP